MRGGYRYGMLSEYPDWTQEIERLDLQVRINPKIELVHICHSEGKSAVPRFGENNP